MARLLFLLPRQAVRLLGIGLCSLFFAGCAAPYALLPHVSLPGAALQPLGRFDKAGQSLEMISSACYAGFRFSGKSARVYLRPLSAEQFAYVQYELDGKYTARVRIDKPGGQALFIQAKEDGLHTVTLYKTTEASSGPLFIDSLSGWGLHALPVDKRPLIEFIGNSITCGAASNPSEIPCGTGSYHDQHDAYFAYGPRVARALNASFMLSSVSGIGIYRNWNSNGPTMPQVYEYTDLKISGRRRDFSQFEPKLVSIALGTNDFSNGDGKTPRLPFNPDAYVAEYIAFIKKVRLIYPHAKLLLLSSPMVSGERNAVFKDCLQRVKEAADRDDPARPVTLYFAKEVKANGCGGHPNVADHAAIADELIPIYRGLLN